jgi:hypothetical protein
MMAASHCGRAVLLQRRLFPLSRPELPTQLTHVGELRLANLLSRLILGAVSMGDMKKMFALLHKINRRLRLQAALKKHGQMDANADANPGE